MAVTAKKTKKVAGGKKKVNINNTPTLKRNKKGILDEIGFGMSETEKISNLQKKAVQEAKLDPEVEGVLKNFTHMTLTDHEIQLDSAKVKLYVEPYNMVLPNGLTYTMYYSRLSDFSVFCTRGNARSMESGQKLSKTQKGYLESVLVDPNEIIWNSTKFNIVCDSAEPKFEDGSWYLYLNGDIQIRDGGNRAVTIEMLKRYLSARSLDFVSNNMDTAIQEFVVRTRDTFEDDKSSIAACINANNSTAHKEIEVLRCYHVFDDVPNMCGKYKDRVVLREAEKNKDTIFVVDLFEDMGCFDSSRFFTEFTPHMLGEDENKIPAHNVRNYFDKTRINNIVKTCKANDGRFDFDTWFYFLKDKDVNETFVELYLYLEHEFLYDLRKMVLDENTAMPEDYISILTKKYKKNSATLVWNEVNRRYLVNSLVPLLAQDKTGKFYFKYSPVEALKNDDFLWHILDDIVEKTSIDNIARGQKTTSVDARNVRVADSIYRSGKKYANKYLGVSFK